MSVKRIVRMKTSAQHGITREGDINRSIGVKANAGGPHAAIEEKPMILKLNKPKNRKASSSKQKNSAK